MDSEAKVIINGGRNRRRLILKGNDLTLLKINLFERFLTERQLYRYYSNLTYRKISYPGFWKKLVKFEDYGLMKSYKYRVGQNGTIVKYFRISEKSLSLLVELNVIDENKVLDIVTIPPKNIDHFIGTKETILKSRLELIQRKYNRFPVETELGSSSKVFPKIIPDAVLKSGPLSLYIEFDTGSETVKVVKRKIECYFKELDKVFFPNEAIILSLLDNSIPNKKGIEDRSIRIMNLYKAITGLPEFHRTWIDVYILPLKNAQMASFEFFSETPLTIREKISDYMDILETMGVFTNLKGELPDYFFINLKQQYGLTIEGILIHDKTSFSKFASIFLYMQPGSIRSNFNLQRITNLQLFNGIRTEIVFAVYRDKESMEEDVKIFGTIRGVRYITLEDINLEYHKSPYVYAMDTKKSLKKITEVKGWPKLF